MPILLALAALLPSLAAAQDTAAPRVMLLGAEGLEDLGAAGVAFVVPVLERDTVLVGEPFTLRLRFGFETRFRDEQMIQLFQRELDVPAQIVCPWLVTLPGARASTAPAPDEGASVALGEDVVLARALGEERRAERCYRTFELARTFVAEQPGEWELVAPWMRFARATRFEDDFVQGRRALDRSEALVRGPAARVVARALPEEGRPLDFSGAIGSFELRVSAEPRELVAGQGLVLELVIAAVGSVGDLSRCEPPRLDERAGFHLRGTLVERTPELLRARYDLVPRGPEVRALPALEFTYFDTTPPAGYRTLTTETIALVVHPAAAAPEEARAPIEAHDTEQLPRAHWLLLPTALLAWLAWRRKRRGRADPR